MEDATPKANRTNPQRNVETPAGETSWPLARTRRGFLGGAFAAFSGLALNDVLNLSPLEAQPPPPPNCSNVGDAFVPVTEFVSKSGKLEANLTVTQANRSVAVIAQAGYQCREMKLRYYEGVEPATGRKWPANVHVPGPGPVLRCHTGDQVVIHMLNNLNPAEFADVSKDDHNCNVINQIGPGGGSTQLYPGTDTPPSCFHGSNISNMHYHGTHVTPDGHGDNVMIDVVPASQPLTAAQIKENQERERQGLTPLYYRGRFTNDFKIPNPPPPDNPAQPMHMGQAPGTHWYHAHKHGSVALQLLNGMSGALVIEGEFDDQLDALMPGLRSTEKVIVIQQIGDTIAVCPGPPINTGIGGDPFPLVNGQVQPTIAMRPGEIQRWRIVNATMSQTAHIEYWFLGKDVYSPTNLNPANKGYVPQIRQIAYDGVQLAPERYGDPAFGQSQRFTVAPGNRIDLLVQAPATPGTSLVVFKSLTPTLLCPQGKSLAPPDPILLSLNVTGAPVTNMQLPSQSQFPKMPWWLQWDEKDPRNAIVGTRNLKFNNDPFPELRPAINGKAFNGQVDQWINLNTAEEWVLENWWASSIHPFHIHVNPFQVLEVYNPNDATHTKLDPPYNWRDVIAIPPARVDGAVTTPGRVRIRSRFLDFPGEFVLHCHILDHEDRGMMQAVVILDPLHPKLPAPGAHH
jgi:FtsP/CotA-like multicopper oxidase with cupredoxin domain